MKQGLFTAIERCEPEGTYYLCVRGYIDSSNFSALEDAARSLVGEGMKFALLDLGECQFVSSAGMEMLIRLSEALKFAGGCIAVLRPQRAVSEVFEMLGVMDEFCIFEGREQALEFVRQYPN